MELAGGGRLVVSPESELSELSGDHLRLERGAFTLELDAGSEPPTLAVAGRTVRPEGGRSSRLALTSDGEDGALTVHRGRVRLGEAGGERLVEKGQSEALPGASKAEARPRAVEVEREPIADEGVPRVARGLGRMTARVPGREEVAEGVELARHQVRVRIRDGIATTTVEDCTTTGAT